MRRFMVCFTLSVVLGGISLGAARAEDAEKTYDFKNAFKANETLFMDMTIAVDGIVTTINDSKPSQTPNHSTLNTVATYKTSKVSSDGWANLELGFQRMVMSGETLGSATQDLAKNLGLKEKKISFAVDPKGDVRETSQAGETNAVQRSAKTFTRQMPYMKFPKKPIAIGDSWYESRQIPFEAAAKAMIVHSTYTLEKVVEEDGEKIAVISTDASFYDTDIPVDSTTPSQDSDNVTIVIKYVYKEYSIKGKGEIRFSLDRGRILTVKDVQATKMHMQGNTDLDKASFSQDVIQDFTQTTTVSYSTTSPIERSDDESSNS